MNDKEIRQLKADAPENYYMDGELSESQAYKYWKSQPSQKR